MCLVEPLTIFSIHAGEHSIAGHLFKPIAIAAFLGYAILVYRLTLIVQRFIFSPLAEFPGPKLAAATGLYEFYFNFFKNGRYVFEIKRLHQIYGPVVRINPHELSIRDAEFYDKLYVPASVRLTEIYNHFVDGVDFEGSHFLTIPHDLHRARRKPLEPYFSKMGLRQFEPVIQELAENISRRFQALAGTGTVVRLDHAMMCYTGDMISRLCCETSTSPLDDTNFSADWYEALHTVVKSMPLFEGFPWMIRLVRLVPERVLLWADSRSQLFNDWKTMAKKHVLEAKNEKKPATEPAERGGRVTLLRHLVNSGLPESELSTERLVNEAQVLLGAGTLGTSRVMDLIRYHVIANPTIREKMREELGPVMSDWPEKKPSWAELERLPYFQSVIKEGLRLSYGVMRRLPRISPKIPIEYREWTIPAGTPVGMSAYMQHTGPQIFPNPFKFDPDRWLPGNVTPLMYSNFVPFTKGSRSCIGMNLANAEMSYLLAALFRNNGPKLQLYETDESDVRPVHDFVVPLPRLDSKGVRVIIE